jgi:hypothetical protein
LQRAVASCRMVRSSARRFHPYDNSGGNVCVSKGRPGAPVASPASYGRKGGAIFASP